MKLPILAFLTLCPFFLLAQSWESTNGPKDRTRSIGIYKYQDFYMIQGSCATFFSEDGDIYKPLRYNNGTVDYEVFLNKIFITYNGGTESLYFDGEEWTRNHVDYYSGRDLESDPYFIYRVTEYFGVERSYTGTDWIELNEGLPSYWIETGPDEGGYIYNTRSITAGDEYLFCGTDTGVYRTDRVFIDWELKSTGLPDAGYTEIASNGDLVFAVNHNHVYRTMDAAETWDLNLELAPENGVNKIEFFNDSVYVMTKTEGLFMSPDSGETWMTMNTGLPSLDLTDMMFEAGEYYVSGEHGVSKGLDNWEFADFGAVCSYNYGMDISQNGIVSTQGDSLYYLGDDSTQWTNVSPEMPIWFINDVENFGDKIIIGVETNNIWGTPSQLLESYDNGLSWGVIHEFSNNYRVELDHSSDFISVRFGDSTFVSADAGYSWIAQSLPIFTEVGVGDGVTAVLFGNDYWFMGRPPWEGRIDRSNDNGASWEIASIGLPWGEVGGIWEFNDTLFATNNSGLFYSIENGDSWNQCGRGIPPGRLSAMVEWEGKYFVSISGNVYVSEDGAISFNIISNGLPGHMFGVLNTGSTLLIERNDILYFGSHYYGIYKLDLTAIETYLSIEEKEDSNDISVYPNPSNSGMVSVAFNQAPSNLSITVFDISGALVGKHNFNNQKTVQLNLEHLKGVYILQIDTGNDVFNKRIVLR